MAGVVRDVSRIRATRARFWEASVTDILNRGRYISLTPSTDHILVVSDRDVTTCVTLEILLRYRKHFHGR